MIFIIQLRAIILGLAIIIGVMLPVSLVTIIFPLKTRLKFLIPTWILFAKAALKYGCLSKIVVSEDRRNLKDQTQFPAEGLVIANHQSYLDIPLFITRIQIPAIMKKEVLYIPIIGWIGYLSGAIPVARKNSKSRRKVLEQTINRLTIEKIGIQVYPEGTRSTLGHPKGLNEIKTTLIALAFEKSVKVTPVSMYGTRGILNKHGIIQPGKEIGIIVHPCVEPKDFDSKEKFIAYCWEQVTNGFKELEEIIKKN